MGQEKSAIVKADRDPAIVPAFDDLADLILQRRFGFPGKRIGDQPHAVANLESASRPRFFSHFPFAFTAHLDFGGIVAPARFCRSARNDIE